MNITTEFFAFAIINILVVGISWGDLRQRVVALEKKVGPANGVYATKAEFELLKSNVHDLTQMHLNKE